MIYLNIKYYSLITDSGMGISLMPCINNILASFLLCNGTCDINQSKSNKKLN